MTGLCWNTRPCIYRSLNHLIPSTECVCYFFVWTLSTDAGRAGIQPALTSPSSLHIYIAECVSLGTMFTDYGLVCLLRLMITDLSPTYCIIKRLKWHIQSRLRFGYILIAFWICAKRGTFENAMIILRFHITRNMYNCKSRYKSVYLNGHIAWANRVSDGFLCVFSIACSCI